MALLKKWLFNELVEQTVEEQVPLLAEWFQSPCGQVLLESEQAVIEQTIPSLFGYHAMQISMSEQVDLLQASPIHHCFNVFSRYDNTVANSSRKTSFLTSQFDTLPFDSDSIDVIILHHVLEFSPNPHQILKEVNRVLIPRGHVIIVGFNPFSLFGLWKKVASLLSKKQQWRYNGITKWRLLDWFKFIDLNKTKVADTFYRLPSQSPLLLKRMAFLEKIGHWLHLPTGGAFIMVARKDINAVTPIKAPWDKVPRGLSAITGAQPTVPRSFNHAARTIAVESVSRKAGLTKNKRLLH